MDEELFTGILITATACFGIVACVWFVANGSAGALLVATVCALMFLPARR